MMPIPSLLPCQLQASPMQLREVAYLHRNLKHLHMSLLQSLVERIKTSRYAWLLQIYNASLPLLQELPQGPNIP